MSQVSLSDWQQFLLSFPDAHILQTGEWGEIKAAFGWQVERVVWDQVGAQILFRPVFRLASLAYIPKGPVGIPSPLFWQEIIRVCRRKRALLLKVEPDCWETEAANMVTHWAGFHPHGRPIQVQRTIVVNLEGKPDDWLMRMKQKTRYNIRLAEKKGVEVAVSVNIQKFHKLMELTSARDGFAVHSLEYYQYVYDLFAAKNQCVLLEARWGEKTLAMIMVFYRGKRAWYFYGASTDEERNRMPTYLLQWEAMKWVAAQGCTEYDLWGIPDRDEDELERDFANREDGLWGVYRFKRGFGGQIKRTIGAFELGFVPGIVPLFRYFEKGARHRSE